MAQFWIYLSDKGQFLPSTMREKAGDCDSALHSLHSYRHSAHRDKYRKVKVDLRVAHDWQLAPIEQEEPQG